MSAIKCASCRLFGKFPLLTAGSNDCEPTISVPVGRCTRCSTHGGRSQYANYWLYYLIQHRLRDYYSTDSIVVGFEQTQYAVAEGGTAKICIYIISPPDIGSAKVYVEVIPEIGGVSAGKTEASKIH